MHVVRHAIHGEDGNAQFPASGGHELVQNRFQCGVYELRAMSPNPIAEIGAVSDDGTQFLIWNPHEGGTIGDGFVLDVRSGRITCFAKDITD